MAKLLSYMERGVLADLARGEIPDYEIGRAVTAKLRRLRWVVGKLTDSSLAITPKGREALAADRDALAARDQANRERDGGGDLDQGP